MVFKKTDLPLRPGHRSVNNVNESTIISCPVVSLSPVYSEITCLPASIPGKGCYVTVTFEFLAGRTMEEKFGTSFISYLKSTSIPLNNRLQKRYCLEVTLSLWFSFCDL